MGGAGRFAQLAPEIDLGPDAFVRTLTIFTCYGEGMHVSVLLIFLKLMGIIILHKFVAMLIFN